MIGSELISVHVGRGKWQYKRLFWTKSGVGKEKFNRERIANCTSREGERAHTEESSQLLCLPPPGRRSQNSSASSPPPATHGTHSESDLLRSKQTLSGDSAVIRTRHHESTLVNQCLSTSHLQSFYRRITDDVASTSSPSRRTHLQPT